MNQFSNLKNKRLKDKYILQEFLGSGTYAQVYQASVLKEFPIYEGKQVEVVAIKVINHENLKVKEKEFLKNEIQFLSDINSLYVVRLFEHFKDDTYTYLVLEYCERGSFEDDLKKREMKRIPERMLKKTYQQILYGIQELHSRKILHRDIKLSNILLKGDMLKLGDLGYSRQFKEDNIYETSCVLNQCFMKLLNNKIKGTILYMAPEQLNYEKYGIEAELYSVGVLFYQILMGQLPFKGGNQFMLSANIEKQEIIFESISPELEDLLRRMLKFKPEDRIKWSELMMHDFFQNEENTGLLNSSHVEDVEAKRKEKNHSDQYKKLELQIQQINLKKQEKKDEIEEALFQKFSQVEQVHYDANQQNFNQPFVNNQFVKPLAYQYINPLDKQNNQKLNNQDKKQNTFVPMQFTQKNTIENNFQNDLNYNKQQLYQANNINNQKESNQQFVPFGNFLNKNNDQKDQSNKQAEFKPFNINNIQQPINQIPTNQFHIQQQPVRNPNFNDYQIPHQQSKETQENLNNKQNFNGNQNNGEQKGNINRFNPFQIQVDENKNKNHQNQLGQNVNVQNKQSHLNVPSEEEKQKGSQIFEKNRQITAKCNELIEKSEKIQETYFYILSAMRDLILLNLMFQENGIQFLTVIGPTLFVLSKKCSLLNSQILTELQGEEFQLLKQYERKRYDAILKKIQEEAGDIMSFSFTAEDQYEYVKRTIYPIFKQFIQEYINQNNIRQFDSIYNNQLRSILIDTLLDISSENKISDKLFQQEKKDNVNKLIKSSCKYLMLSIYAGNDRVTQQLEVQFKGNQQMIIKTQLGKLINEVDDNIKIIDFEQQEQDDMNDYLNEQQQNLNNGNQMVNKDINEVMKPLKNQFIRRLEFVKK